MNSKLNFDADTLACALALTGKATPTRAELTTALGLLNTPNRGGLKTMPPAGPVPTVNELLATGRLVPTIDGHGLRVPPLPLAEQDARLAETVPERILKLNTPSLPAAHEIKSELVPVRQGCPTEWTAVLRPRCRCQRPSERLWLLRP